MPKIHTIPSDQVINGNDKLLGSDGAPGTLNVTKNYLVDDLKTYILGDAGAVSFGTVAVPGQDDVVADGSAGTLNLVGNGSVTITNNASTDTVTITGVDTNTEYTAGSGLSLASEEFAVDSTVVRTSGNQTIDDAKTFTTIITGDITGNSGTVTDGVYTTGSQTITATKNFSVGLSSSEYVFNDTFGKIKEQKITITNIDIIGTLNGGGDLGLVAAPGANKMIVPLSITAKLNFATTVFDLTEDLYIGHQSSVSSDPEDWFYKVRSSFVNATGIQFEHYPSAHTQGQHTVVNTNQPLVLFASPTNAVLQGDSTITFNILYREVDFT